MLSVKNSNMMTLLPLMFVILSAFTIIGTALPVLPQYVHYQLGYGAFTVGLVTGVQFLSSLLSRLFAGRHADKHGGRHAIFLGLTITIAGGLLYLLSYLIKQTPVLALIFLLTGRALIGAAESLIITGGMALGLGLTTNNKPGRVIAWVGTAMFAAFALGAPLGSLLFKHFGFMSTVILTCILPLVLAHITSKIPEYKAYQDNNSHSFKQTMSAVCLPGLGVALNGVGFSALISFSVLVFNDNHWSMTWLPVSAFAGALIIARLLISGLIDESRFPLIAIVFSLFTLTGQLVMWTEYSQVAVTAGAALTGIGWGMVYPAFGSEAIRRSGNNNRGFTMAIYSALPDLAIGLSSPLLGFISLSGNTGDVYLLGAYAAALAVPVTIFLSKKK
ncbi:TPA: MFS transporter [Escherichia coli]|nr:MFS transporter [Escherichia coli]HAX9800147.1 MFS transporter [Escherichia coli]HAY0055446.1 MFS transporter [Escherichia coli]